MVSKRNDWLISEKQRASSKDDKCNELHLAKQVAHLEMIEQNRLKEMDVEENQEFQRKKKQAFQDYL